MTAPRIKISRGKNATDSGILRNFGKKIAIVAITDEKNLNTVFVTQIAQNSSYLLVVVTFNKYTDKKFYYFHVVNL